MPDGNPFRPLDRSPTPASTTEPTRPGSAARRGALAAVLSMFLLVASGAAGAGAGTVGDGEPGAGTVGRQRPADHETGGRELADRGAERQGGQEPEPRATYRADVEMVVHNVAVVDPEGEPVRDLGREDFRVFDEGRRQEISLFLTSGEAPLDVALVLDFSSSIAPVAHSARRAALTFLNSLTVEDCVYVLPFTERLGPDTWARAPSPSLRAFIDRIRVSGGTALYDALLQGLARVERTPASELVVRGDPELGPALARSIEADEGPEHPGGADDAAVAAEGDEGVGTGDPDGVRGEGETTDAPSGGGPVACGEPGAPGDDASPEDRRRRAVVLVSDGADEDSTATYAHVMAAARASSAPVFPVALGLADQDRQLHRRLLELARATGGRLIEDVTAAELRRAYGDVVALLRGTYLIGYYPDGGGNGGAPTEGGADEAGAGGDVERDARRRWREIDIGLRRPAFRALHRPGYYRR